MKKYALFLFVIFVSCEKKSPELPDRDFNQKTESNIIVTEHHDGSIELKYLDKLVVLTVMEDAKLNVLVKSKDYNLTLHERSQKDGSTSLASSVSYSEKNMTQVNLMDVDGDWMPDHKNVTGSDGVVTKYSVLWEEVEK